ncbi:MAG: acylphosphatase [Anaerolineales bacterium]
MAENAPEPSDPARAHIWVTGRVQGVGFRAFVEYSAQVIGVSGWVRNVGYDTVEAVAEGTQAQVDRFVQMMKTGPRAARVDECRVDVETPAGEFQDFQVRFSR